MQAVTKETLRALREAHQLTQRALGELLGYTANYISRLERGDEAISPKFARLLRSMLGNRKKIPRAKRTP